MGVAVRLTNYEQVFESCKQPTIINEFNLENEQEVQRLSKLIITHYEGDTLNSIPVCECGQTSGRFNLHMPCPECGTSVSIVTERALEPLLWLRPPRDVATFINPQVWEMFRSAINVSDIGIFEHMVDPHWPIHNDTHRILKKVKTIYEENPQFKRGINSFYEHFDAIMEQLFLHGVIYGNEARQREDFRQFIIQNRDRIFTRYLPITNKLVLITEKTPTSTFSDKTNKIIIDAIWDITACEHSAVPMRPRVRESHAMRCNAKLSEYYQTFIKDNLRPKRGLARKHLVGSRLDQTFRAVITSLSDNHDYNELHLPWSLSVMVFEYHLLNRLKRMGYGMIDGKKLINESIVRYNPIIDELFKTMIAQSPYNGVPVLFNRNPTLMRGSIQTLLVTHVKTEVEDNSIGMSVLALKAPNADFDGDTLSGYILPDDEYYQAFERLAPHHGVLDLMSPRKLSSNISIPAPPISTIGAWMADR